MKPLLHFGCYFFCVIGFISYTIDEYLLLVVFDDSCNRFLKYKWFLGSIYLSVIYRRSRLLVLILHTIGKLENLKQSLLLLIKTKTMKQNKTIGKTLSKSELKKTVGGVIEEGHCTETCGVEGNTKSCSSSNGECSRDKAKPSTWIKCDNETITCPTS